MFLARLSDHILRFSWDFLDLRIFLLWVLLLLLYGHVLFLLGQVEADRLLFDHIDQLQEQILDILAGFGRNLVVGDPQLLRLLLALLAGHLPVLQVYLVGNQKRKTFNGSVVVVELEPHVRIIQGHFVSDIDHNQRTLGILQVVGDQGSESLLAGCIPQLQSIHFGRV